jgi:AbrB family looped-hinge helix DNA binding protein
MRNSYILKEALLIRVILKDRGQLTIPAKLRKSLRLRAGDLFEVEIRGTYLIFKPLEVLERAEKKSEESEEGPAA